MSRVAVIGAGASGLVAMKVLGGAGLDVVAFERGNEVGGLWIYENSNGLSPAYRSLHANTTKTVMEYSDWPMPKGFPEYPAHHQIAAYLQTYADHFELEDRIRFGHRVTSVLPGGSGWLVTVRTADGESTETFDAVVVASGHFWEPAWPDPAYPGVFDGRQLHSCGHRDPVDFKGRNVLVVGAGNSAMDIAVDLNTLASNVLLSVRTPTHILPKYIFGEPFARFAGRFRWLPWKLRQSALALILRMWRGGYGKYALAEPRHGIYEAHPTLSDALLSKIRHGDIVPRPAIERFGGQTVHFTDGSVDGADCVIWCTGYRVGLPFLDPELVRVVDNRIDLYFRIYPSGIAGLAFVGFVQQRGAIMPVSEEQSRLVAAYLTGEHELPDDPEMRGEIAEYHASSARRFLDTSRHRMEVEQEPYIRMLRKERRRRQGAVR